MANNTKEYLYDEMRSEILARLHAKGPELDSQVIEILLEMSALASDLYGEIDRLKGRVRILEGRVKS